MCQSNPQVGPTERRRQACGIRDTAVADILHKLAGIVRAADIAVGHSITGDMNTRHGSSHRRLLPPCWDCLDTRHCSGALHHCRCQQQRHRSPRRLLICGWDRLDMCYCSRGLGVHLLLELVGVAGGDEGVLTDVSRAYGSVSSNPESQGPRS
jgi:hypothetical protein